MAWARLIGVIGVLGGTGGARGSGQAEGSGGSRGLRARSVDCRGKPPTPPETGVPNALCPGPWKRCGSDCRPWPWPRLLSLLSSVCGALWSGDQGVAGPTHPHPRPHLTYASSLAPAAVGTTILDGPGPELFVSDHCKAQVHVHAHCAHMSHLRCHT